MLGILLFCAGVVVSLAASWLLVSRLERLGERAGFSEAWLGLVAALAADAPEITSSVVALARGQASVGAGVVIGSNVFNLAALLGLAAVVAGWIGFHRRVVVLSGVPAVWVAAVCLLTVAGVVAPAPGLALTAVVLVPYVAVLGMRRARLEGLRLPAGWVRWLVAAVHEEEAELAEAIRPRRGTWRDAVAAVAALITVVGASTVMEVAATAVGRRHGVADIVTGGLVLAVVTSLPNATSAVYLARRGRGAAVLSTALSSNAINVVAGLLIPASLAGLGPGSGQGTLVAAWYAGLTVLALALAYRGRGLGRAAGAAIIGGYLVFVTALVITVEQGGVRPAAAVFPAAAVAGAGALLLTWPRRSRAVAADLGGLWQRESVLPGWSIGRLWRISLVLCCVVAACDAASGPHLILIGLLIAGPCCALLTARWALTAAASGVAVAFGILLGLPDQIFATLTQYAFLAAVAAVGTAATVGAAVLQRQRP
jgi:cation:H+ antiporter